MTFRRAAREGEKYTRTDGRERARARTHSTVRPARAWRGGVKVSGDAVVQRAFIHTAADAAWWPGGRPRVPPTKASRRRHRKYGRAQDGRRRPVRCSFGGWVASRGEIKLTSHRASSDCTCYYFYFFMDYFFVFYNFFFLRFNSDRRTPPTLKITIAYDIII